MPYYNYLTLSIDLLRVAEGGGRRAITFEGLQPLLWSSMVFVVCGK